MQSEVSVGRRSQCQKTEVHYFSASTGCGNPARMSDRQSKDFHTSYHQSCASEYQCRSHLCVSKDVGEAQEENPIDYSERRQNIVYLEIQKKPKSLRR